MTIVGPILDMVVISHVVVVGKMCEEFGRHIHMGLLHLLLCLVRAHHFAYSIVTLWGYKSKQPPLCTFTSSHTNTFCLLASLLAPEKERDREKGRFLGFRECCFFSFPLKPWQNKTGLLPQSCRHTCKAS
jgi:hypothetical protein